MAGNQTINCAALQNRNSFSSYIDTLRQSTGNDFALIDQCKGEVCTAIWGDGNSDISGIGMIIGYIIEVVVGVLLATTLCVICRRSPPPKVEKSKLAKLLSSAFATFCETGLYFAFAVEIAALVVLARFDFDISDANLGSNTVQATWAVSQLVMLPLILPVSMSHILRESSRNPNSTSDPAKLRFLMFVVVWLLSFYPFLSMMIASFQPSQIGDSKGDVVTNQEWVEIWEICHTGVTPISNQEYTVMKGFNVAGSLLVSLYAVTRIIWLTYVWNVSDDAEKFRQKFISKWSFRTYAASALVFMVAVLSIGQLWAIWRLRQLQEDISNVTNAGDSDSEWGFGQVTAVVVFVPVLVESITALFDIEVRSKTSHHYQPIHDKLLSEPSTINVKRYAQVV